MEGIGRIKDVGNGPPQVLACTAESWFGKKLI
jgi:hypothetical protein